MGSLVARARFAARKLRGKATSSASPWARATAGLRRGNSATQIHRVRETDSVVPPKVTGAPGRMVIAAHEWTVIVGPGPMETAAAIPKAATASPSCPVVRRLTGNLQASFTSHAKPPPAGGGFAFLLLAD